MFDFLIGNDLLSSLIAFGLVLIPAVIVHEFGHFIAAKMVGITILEFGIGYPPRLFSFGRWRETKFTFNLIPLGGFVMPLGEDMIRSLSPERTEAEREALQERMEREAPPLDDRAELRARGFTKFKTVNEASPLGRIFFMAAGAIFNIAAALIIFIVIGLIGVQQIVGAGFVLTDVRPDSALAAAGVQSGDVIETLNGEYIAGTEGFIAAASAAQTEDVAVGILRPVEQGQPERITLTIPAGALADEVALTSGLRISTIQEGSPSDTAGLLPGDSIVGLDGQSLENEASPFEVLNGINVANAGNEIMIEIVRDGERMKLPITPRANPAQGQGYLGAGVETEVTAASLGASFAVYGVPRYVPLAFGDAVTYGFEKLNSILATIASLPGRLLSGSATPEESRVVSIVGISQLGGALLQNSAETGNPFDILNFIALVNIALGLTNLLPLPPLDGGRILFVLIEMLRGKPMSQRREEFIMIAGMVFLLALGVVVILQDIVSPIVDLLPR